MMAIAAYNNNNKWVTYFLQGILLLTKCLSQIERNMGKQEDMERSDLLQRLGNHQVHQSRILKHQGKLKEAEEMIQQAYKVGQIANSNK